MSKIILSVLLIVIGLPATAQDAPATRGEVVIVSWNIEWLGTPGSRKYDGQNVAQDPAKLAQRLLRAKPDVIAFQEIRAPGSIDDDPDQESTEIQALLEALSEQGGTWDQVFFPAHGGSGAQLTGLAWNSERVTPVGEWKQIHVDLGPGADASAKKPWTAGPRPPHGMMFSCGEGLTDFVVVPIHWKSSWNGDHSEARAEEAAEIIAGLPVCFDDQDIVIIGDSNCSSTREPAIRAMEAAGFRDANRADRPTHLGGRALDRAFIPDDQPEFRRSRFTVLALKGRAKNDFARDESDHFPIVVTLQAGRDDD